MDVKRLALLIFCVALVCSASAQDGALDAVFGDQGRIWLDAVTSTSYDAGQKLIALANGNLFMAGSCDDSTFDAPCVAWLTPTGAPASGYGPTGNGTAWFHTFVGWPSDSGDTTDAAAFPDGRIIVIAQRTAAGAYMALLSKNGAGLDASVGNGTGYVQPSFKPLLVRVTPQNQVIVAGVTDAASNTLIVARYNSDFRLDTAFGTSGSTTITFADGGLSPLGMTLQKDGKIVAIGVILGSPDALGIVRLTADGHPDVNFGINSDGKFESRFNKVQAFGSDIVEDKQGRLIFVGSVTIDNTDDSEWLVGRLLSGGATDASFNGGSPQLFTIAGSSMRYNPSANCVALQRDGRIVVTGTMDRPSPISKYFGLARFNDDGSFDDNFGGSGQSYADLSPEGASAVTDSVTSMVIVPGGIIVAGNTQVQGGEVRFSAAKEDIDLLFANGFE